MLLRRIFLAVFGFSAGMITAGGVFTVLLAVGLIPRFAGRTHTGRKVMLYETMVILGTAVGDIVSVFEPQMHWGMAAGQVLLVLYGGFAGIFVGCLAMAIAEMLDSIPIFARRIGFRHGLGVAVLAMALGRMAGSLLYFYEKMYLFGG